MIVKNEEKTLARVLECARHFADEIIIVDTGSIDSTKQIAKIYTKNVFDFVWNDDFSEARNFAFSKATCDYQMWLDADDYITRGNIEKIIALKNSDKNADMFMFSYAMGFDENGKASLRYFRERLMRRNSNFLWEGFIHEAISPRGEVLYEDIEIQHRKESVSDPSRNLRIFEKAKKDGKVFGARLTYYYARELFYHKKYRRAITEIGKFLKMDSYIADRMGAYLILADCYIFLGETGKAKEVLFDAVKTILPTSEICCKIASIFSLLGEKEQSIFWYNSALSCKKQAYGFVCEKFEKYVPLLELVRLYFEIGDTKKSYHFHNTLKQSFPDDKKVLYNEKFFVNFFKNS